jgi:hypothetical protein
VEYTVYVLGGEVKVAEAEAVASPLPEGAETVLVTTSREEAAGAVGECVLRGYCWTGSGWLEEATYRCAECGQPATQDGQGGFTHAEPADAAACVIFGGGMLRSLFPEED